MQWCEQNLLMKAERERENLLNLECFPRQPGLGLNSWCLPWEKRQENVVPCKG